jgi:large exoprotein involved in heme utilization and adhesion
VALRLEAFFALVVSCAAEAGMPREAASQHITVDGRLSPAQTLVGPNYTIGANLGKQVGSNLFHSFGQFGLATGESTTFATAVRVSPRAATSNGLAKHGVRRDQPAHAGARERTDPHSHTPLREAYIASCQSL